MSDTRSLRVFVASPSDLDKERELVKSTIDRYNATLRHSGRTYELVGWEATRGTARRPQDQINELICSSEFLIVLFKASWGSDPGSPFGYTSGTEEELFTGLLELGTAEQPLEDIWVGFIDDPAPAAEITALRTQLQQRHALQYESIAGDLDLDRKLSDRLEGWQKTAGIKTARQFDLVPQSGRNVLGAAKLRHDGESFIRLGRTDLGLEKLGAAAELGGPKEQLAYARALGRRGRLEEALMQATAAIDVILAGSIELNSTLAGDAFVTEAGILRRQGSDLEAITRLGIILGELDDRASAAWRVRARILDERGLAYQRLERLPEASADFVAAHQLRLTHGRSLEIAQSLVNLIRLKTRERDFEAAGSYAETMLITLDETTPSDLHANAWTAIAQLRLRQGLATEGISYGLQALRLNEQTANTSGVAKSLLVLAQCSRASGNLDEARGYAERCIEVNESMGNRWGADRARWQLDQLAAEESPS
jgi:tetratricopeptide (TPR) repeat protein